MPTVCIITRFPLSAAAKIKDGVKGEYEEGLKKYGEIKEKNFMRVYIPDGDKMKLIQLYDFETGDIGEFLERTMLFNMRYLSEVPGYEYERFVGYNVEEVIALKEKTK